MRNICLRRQFSQEDCPGTGDSLLLTGVPKPAYRLTVVRNPRIEELFLGLAHSAGFRKRPTTHGGAHQGEEGLVSALGTNPGAPLRLSGLTLTAKAAYTALLFRETQLPLILVADGSKQAETLFPLLRTFCSLLGFGDDTPVITACLLWTHTLPGRKEGGRMTHARGHTHARHTRACSRSPGAYGFFYS